MPKILGIDPGLQTTGYGCVEVKGDQYTLISAGVILTSNKNSLAERLDFIYQDIVEVIEQVQPDLVSIEKIFFLKNVTSGIDVSQARGVLMLACQQAKLPIYEYTPLQVKMSLTGYGRATKDQIQVMVKKFLNLKVKPKPDDCADALALAITQSQRG